MTMKLLQIVLLLVMSLTAMAQQPPMEKADSTICPDSPSSTCSWSMDFRIFTWVGYKKSELKIDDLHYLNVQGDEGNAGLFVVTPIFEVDLWKRCSLTLSGTYYHRNTHYKEHSDKESKTFETKAGLTYYF